MKKLAIGLVALAILAGSMASPAAAQEPWGYLYFSTDPTSYNCDDGGAAWASGSKTFYIVIDSPGWDFGDAYNGIEFGLDYPEALFFVGIASPDAPAPLFIGSCGTGHCSYQMGTGGQVPNNPWTAVALDFLNFGAGNNLGFTLAPADNSSPRAQGGPAWAYFDAADPPVYIPQPGDGTAANPGWQQGFVMLNYDQATASAEAFPREVYRGGPTPTAWPAENAGDPCARNKVTANDESSWGALKAGF